MKLVIIIVTSLNLSLFAKDKLYSIDCIQGLWVNISSKSEYQNERRIAVNFKNRQLLIYYEIGKESSTFELFEYMVGFTHKNPNSDSLKIKDIKPDGKFFVTVFEAKNTGEFTIDFSIEPMFNCDKESYYYENMGSGSPFDYNKITKLPTLVLNLLVKRCTKDNRDYFQEYNISR